MIYIPAVWIKRAFIRRCDRSVIKSDKTRDPAFFDVIVSLYLITITIRFIPAKRHPKTYHLFINR